MPQEHTPKIKKTTDEELNAAKLAECNATCECLDGYAAVCVANVQRMDKELATIRARCERLEKDYYSLIMAVSQKFPNETRHQTALRYILERESHVSDGKAHQALEVPRE